MMSKTMRGVAVIMLIAAMVLAGMPAVFPQTAMAADTPVLKVLEVQPGPARNTSYGTTGTVAYKLKQGPSYSDGKYIYDVTQMSMNRFISSIDEINGLYDVVYIGENSGTYTAKGSKYENKFQGSGNEYYSGIDITDRRAEILLDFINSGQPAIFTETIFSSGKSATKLYKNLYKESSKVKPVYNKIVKVTQSISQKDLYTKIKDTYTASGKRPQLSLKAQPKAYDGTQGSYEEKNALSFAFDLSNSGNRTMDVTLYVDLNGDGIFKDVGDESGKVTKQEIVAKFAEPVPAGEGYTLNWPLPGNYTGVLPWKIVVRDRITGAQDYQTGYAAFKSSGKMVVNVLQLTPSGNTLDLSTLKDNNNKNMLDTNEYKINVTTLSVREFNNNPDRYELNGKYDMVVLGFADTYGTVSDDITSAKAIKKLKDFIASGQSVMFTHDTQTFELGSTSGWGRNLTREFRTLIGQNVYETEGMPYGFSWLTLTRAKTGEFPRSNNTVKLNDALVTNYPYILGDIQVSETHHQYFQLDLEDEDVVPFYTLSGSGNGYMFDSNDGRNDYYTYSKGNITYSGTGHSKPGAYLTEKQLFVNTMVKAIRGANHAPIISVSGIQDGQYVDAAAGLSFDFLAEDFDGEPTLDVNIYVDTKNNGSFSLLKSYTKQNGTAVVNGESRSEKLTGLNIPQSQSFAIKIVVTDAHGAQGSKTVTPINVRPSLALKVPVANGYLVGDQTELSYQVSCEGIGALSNIAVRTSINTVKNSNSELGISVPPANGWYNSGDELLHSVAGTQNITLKASFIKPGTYLVNNRFTYDSYGGQGLSYTANSFTANVKTGALNISVQKSDDNGIAKGVKDVPVQVRNKETGVVYTGTTGSTGFIRLQTGGVDGEGSTVILPSGTYDITIAPPVGYAAATGNTQTITLNYGSPERNVDFSTTGTLVTALKINNTKVYTVSNGTGKALLTFDLVGDVKYLSMDLELPGSVQGKISYSTGKLKDKSGNSYDFIMDGNKLIFPASEEKPLKAGSYSAEFTIKIANSVPVGVYPLVVGKVTYRDKHLTYSSSEYDSLVLNAEALKINVLEKPKLQ